MTSPYDNEHTLDFEETSPEKYTGYFFKISQICEILGP